MLAWVVIDRHHLRQATPFASLHSSPLFPSLIYLLYFLLLTLSPSQRPLLNPFAINPLRTLLISTEGIPLRALPPTTAILSAAYPLLHISCIFNLLRTPLHFFALPKNSTLLFSSDSALCVKKHNHRVEE